MRQLGSILLVALSLSGYEGVELSSSTELQRITNKEGRVDAVLIQNNGGATVGYSYDVAIVPTGKNPDEASWVARLWSVRSPINDLPILTWRRARDLTIGFESATVTKFTNSWASMSVDKLGYPVEISLKHPEYGFAPD